MIRYLLTKYANAFILQQALKCGMAYIANAQVVEIQQLWLDHLPHGDRDQSVAAHPPSIAPSIDARVDYSTGHERGACGVPVFSES